MKKYVFTEIWRANKIDNVNGKTRVSWARNNCRICKYPMIGESKENSGQKQRALFTREISESQIPKACWLIHPALALFLEQENLIRTNSFSLSFFLIDVPIDGKWSCWSNWSACSGGSKTRQRQCNNPLPQKDGRPCSGPASETLNC